MRLKEFHFQIHEVFDAAENERQPRASLVQKRKRFWVIGGFENVVFVCVCVFTDALFSAVDNFTHAAQEFQQRLNTLDTTK